MITKTVKATEALHQERQLSLGKCGLYDTGAGTSNSATMVSQAGSKCTAPQGT